MLPTAANAPVTVVQAGTYAYNNAGGGLIYSLSPEWSVSANGSWDIWRYQTAAAAIQREQLFVVGTGAAYGLGVYATDLRPDGTPVKTLIQELWLGVA